jgi:hypothetical protein
MIILLLIILFLIIGISTIVLSLNGLRVGRTLGNVGFAMKMIEKDDNPEEYWISIIAKLVFGILLTFFGVWLYLNLLNNFFL